MIKLYTHSSRNKAKDHIPELPQCHYTGYDIGLQFLKMLLQVKNTQDMFALLFTTAYKFVVISIKISIKNVLK